MFNDNKQLGQFDLVGIPPAPRGIPQIEVTFDIDTNGIVHVSAKDLGTGKEHKIQITGSTKLNKEEVERMKQEAKSNEADDKKKKEMIEAENNADSVIFQTKKVMDEFKDKIDESTKKNIDEKIKELEEARKSADPQKINHKIDELNKVVQEIGTKMYQEAAKHAQQKDKKKKNDEEDVVDAEFKENKEE